MFYNSIWKISVLSMRMSASNFNFVIIVINLLNHKEDIMKSVEKITPDEAKKIYYAQNPYKKEGNQND